MILSTEQVSLHNTHSEDKGKEEELVVWYSVEVWSSSIVNRYGSNKVLVFAE